MSNENLFPKIFIQEVCMQFRQLRLERDLSLEDIANEVHISVRLLQRIDDGKCLPINGLYKLLAFYGKKIRVVLE